MATMEIKQQIEALEQSKEFHYQKYLNDQMMIDNKLERIEKQIEKTKSQVKRDLLKRHIDWYEQHTMKMDESLEAVTNHLNAEIDKLNKIMKTREEEKQKEKKCFEYNIEKIRKCCKSRSAATMFDALECVANALEIIRAEKNRRV